MHPVFRILLVESTPQAIARVKSTLPSTFDITVAKDAESLKARLQYPNYDLALIEPWQEKDGAAQFQPWVVADYSGIPIVVLTVKEKSRGAAELEKLGALEFLHKSDASYQKLARTCLNLVRYHRIMTQDPLALPDGLILFDHDLTVQSFNTTAETLVREIAGKALTIGLSAREFLIREDFHYLQTLVSAAGVDGKDQMAFPMPVSYGGLRWLEISIHLLFGPEKQVSGLCLYIQDLTRLKEAHETLRTRESTLSALINASPGATFLIDLQGKILAANQVVSDWFDIPHSAFVGTSIFECSRSPLSEIRQSVIQEVLRTGQMVTMTDFSFGRYMRTHVFPIFDDIGDVHQIAVFVMDITEQKQAEDIFQRRDAIMQSVNFASERFLQAESWHFRIDEVLQRWAEATAANRAFIYKRDLSDSGETNYSLLHGWDSSRTLTEEVKKNYQKFSLQVSGFSNLEQIIQRGEVAQLKLTDTTPQMFHFFQDNNVKALLLVPVFLEGEMWGFIGFADCVTVREWSAIELDAVKTAAHILSAALRREQDEMSRAALLNALPDLMFLFDHHGAYVDYHTQNMSLLAVSPDYFLGKKIEQVLPGEVAKVTKTAFDKNMLTGIPQIYEYTLPVGNSLYWEGRMVRSGDGAVTIIRDITEQRRFEEELRHSEKAVSDLYEITSSGVLSFGEKQLALLQMGCQRFKMENGIILRATPNSFEVVQAYSPKGMYKPYTNIPLQESFSQEVIHSNRTLTIEDATRNHWKNHPAHRIHHLQSYMGAPLVVGGKLYGALGFSSRQPKSQAFTRAEQRFLHLMVQWIGLEMEREQYLVRLQQYADEFSIKNKELAEARDEALEVSRLKTEFLATMSHEIRTPMNAVMGMTELLLESALDAEQREYAETARDSARLLLSLLNNVLDFSKIEAGKLVLEQIDFDSQKVIDDSVAMFGLQAQHKKIQLNAFVSPQIPRRLRGDPMRFSQVIINLVGNAIKFTDQGHILVWCELLSETPKSVELMVQVRDTGVGLSETSQARIFQPFTQADGSTTRRFGGTGLGLTIAKRLVEKMEGAVGVESVEGAGSTFWFTAKFQPVSDASPDSPRVELPVRSGDRILLFESLEEARNLWQRYLEDWHIPFDLAGNPDELLERIKSAKESGLTYTCCILDYEGLHAAGGKNCSRIIHQLNANHLRTILITGFEKRLRTQNLPAIELFAGRLTRPISRGVVERTLACVFKEGEQKQPVALTPARPPAARAVETMTDKLIMVAEDNLANQHLAVVQLQHLGYRVVTVSTGMRAVEELARRYQDYGLVLMDVQMPEMDGFEATRLIRRGEDISGGHIPIVAMTANVLHDDRQACLDAGMDDFIGKPVLLDDLQKVIARCFQHHEAGLEVRSVVLEPTSQDSLLDERVLDDLRSLNQSDKPDFLMQLIELYFDDSKSLMQNITAAASLDDLDRLRKAVHSLKGISSNLGAARLSKMCWQVENAIRNNLPLADDWLDALDHEYAITCDALRQVSLHSISETRGKLN